MAKIDCVKCHHFYCNSCTHDFRYAAGAAGQKIDSCIHVFFCRDFDEIELQRNADERP